MKVYVVTDGIYSDYHVVACVLDEEQAKNLVSKLSDDGDYEVFDTDDPTINSLSKGYDLYKVVKKSDGTMQVVFISSCGFLVDEAVYANTMPSFNGEIRYYSTEVLAADEDHAIKIAADRFAKLEAEKQGL